MGSSGVLPTPLWSPAPQGDGRSMLRPYGSARTYPCQ